MRARRILLALLLLALSIGRSSAQAAPVMTVKVAWDAVSGATGYKCYLDGTFIVASSTTTCAIPVPTFGPHTIGVTATNATTESTPATLAITALTAPTNLRIVP